MRRATIAIWLLPAAAATAACDPTPAATGPTAPVPPATTPAGGTAPAPGGEAKTAALPDFTGMGLQAAQDRAQAAGFHLLHSHDARGRSRSQIDDRNWKVCSQAPAAGTALNGQPVTLGVVKFGEACP
ncbi:PASTA domain-containing protein [Kitasatospora cineracea]|uniref:PASTA domain-containing protein n=1 Tax=Kitasatospora cineracea TaxID=88074 RepID=UPI0037B91AC2